MDVLVKPASASISSKGSRFLAELMLCASQADARTIIKMQKTKYKDASHVVHAFVVGNGAEVTGMSDDGEPSGTAGRPVLDVLNGRTCTNVLLTVTRWFGGTLLGTGGLVKAYGDAAKLVIAEADSQGAFEELIAKQIFSFETDYTLYERLKRAMAAYHFFNVAEQFADGVTVSGEIRADEYNSFAVQLKDMSSGRIRI
jgi:uncharacterized YigZ family protein